MSGKSASCTVQSGKGFYIELAIACAGVYRGSTGVCSACVAAMVNVPISLATSRMHRVGGLGNIPTFEPAVGLFVDGAFRSRSLLSTGDLLDVNHIEVLNGPQGKFFSADAELTEGLNDAPDSACLGRAMVNIGGPISNSVDGVEFFQASIRCAPVRSSDPLARRARWA